MSDETSEISEDNDSTLSSEPSSRGRAELRLIGLIFLLPLLLMFVTSLVCIAIVLARQ